MPNRPLVRPLEPPPPVHPIPPPPPPPPMQPTPEPQPAVPESKQKAKRRRGHGTDRRMRTAGREEQRAIDRHNPHTVAQRIFVKIIKVRKEQERLADELNKPDLSRVQYATLLNSSRNTLPIMISYGLKSA